MAITIFTYAERTVKKYTVGQAVNQALAVLRAKRYPQVCTNAVSRRNNDEKITLEQMSKLIEELVDDTLFYDGAYHGFSIVHGQYGW